VTHGKCVQPLQSVELSWQPCSRLSVAWTLTQLEWPRMVWLGCWESINIVLRSSYHSGLCGMFDVASWGEELMTLVIASWHWMQPPLSAGQTTVSLSLPKAPMSWFSHTYWVATISLLKFAFCCHRWSSTMEPRGLARARRGKLGRSLRWSSPMKAVQDTLRINVVMLLAL
jgi:hypothetical protein